MRKVKGKATYGIIGFTLILGLWIGKINVSMLYAANKIDISRPCSLTLKTADSGTYGEELSRLQLEARIYKVADVAADGTYTPTSAFESLTVKDRVMKQEEWEKLTDKSMELAEGKAEDARIEITNGRGTITDLETGLYLVIPEAKTTELYEYQFEPYLVPLPQNLYEQSEVLSDDKWNYQVESDLKPERSPRYGSFKICKNLTSYNTALEKVTFVFQVEGVDKQGNSVYSNVFSTTYTAAGQKEILVEHIPAGTIITVTEVYSGASYRLETEAEKTVVISADEIVTADFSNTYNDELIPGYGVTNHFEYDENEGWQWSTQE